MQRISRREQLRGMLGMAALTGMPRMARADDPPVPPEGIGHRIKHVSYSDIGGRPDSVQIMSNRNHLYVGHMFSDGVTILDASDPRNLKPSRTGNGRYWVGFFKRIAAEHSELFRKDRR